MAREEAVSTLVIPETPLEIADVSLMESGSMSKEICEFKMAFLRVLRIWSLLGNDSEDLKVISAFVTIDPFLKPCIFKRMKELNALLKIGSNCSLVSFDLA